MTKFRRDRQTPGTDAWHVARIACASAALVLLPSLPGFAWPPPHQAAFSWSALNARLPITRETHYVMNARVRPLLLFWVGRDDVGGARITWRSATNGRQSYELLVGSDPDRAPRRINRWGFIAEELSPLTGDVIGVMKESGERTLDEAEANVKREQDGGSTFRAVRTRIDGNRAVSGTVEFRAPSHLTYDDLETLLSLIPIDERRRPAIDLPAGTERGFLIALASMARESTATCRTANTTTIAPGRQVPYLYNQAIYDLSLTSCAYVPIFETKKGAFPDIVDGRFQVRNRRTGEVTKFQMAYGTAGDLLEVPVRVVFQPLWWFEVELLLNRPT